MIDAGFSIDEEFDPTCDGPPGGAACAFVAVRDSDALTASLSNPGDDADGLRIAEKGRSLIRILADQKRGSQ